VTLVAASKKMKECVVSEANVGPIISSNNEQGKVETVMILNEELLPTLYPWNEKERAFLGRYNLLTDDLATRNRHISISGAPKMQYCFTICSKQHPPP